MIRPISRIDLLWLLPIIALAAALASRSVWTDLIVPNGGLNEVQQPQKIADNQWTGGLDVEPMIDGVRRRRGSAKSNTTPLQAIAESYDAGTDNLAFTDTSSEYHAQTFSHTSNLTVRQISSQFTIDAGTPTGSIEAAIYTTTTGVPNAAVTGADFSDFTTVAASSLATDTTGVWFHFTLNDPVSLTASTTYAVVFRHLAAAAGNTIDHWYANTTGTYANGSVYTSTDTVSWLNLSTSDINFRIYSGNAVIRAVADYRTSDGAAQRHFVFADDELYKNVSGVMTMVSNRKPTAFTYRHPATSNTTATDTLPSWVVGNDQFLLTTGDGQSWTHYVRGGTEYSEEEGLSAPTAALTLGVSGGDALDDGTYSVDYYFWNSDLGVQSNRKSQGVVSAANSVATSSQHITISGIPANPTNAGERATHVRIELKEVGSTVFRLVKELAIGTTSTTIKDTDLPTTIEAEYNHDKPPTHIVKAIAENRQFIGNIVDSTAPNGSGYHYRVMFSAINGITPYYHSFPANNYRDFGLGDGDYVTALKFLPPRLMVVGLRDSIWAIDARQPATSDKVRISETVGVAHHTAIVIHNGTMYFMSDSKQARGFYRWRPGDGEPVRIRGADDTIAAMEVTQWKFSSMVVKPVDQDRSQILWTATIEDGTKHDRVFCYDTALDALSVWTKGEGREINVMGVIEESGVSKVYAGGYAGIEYELDTTDTSDDGRTYTGSMSTKVFDGGVPFMEKKLKGIGAVYESDAKLNVSVEPDYGEKSTRSGSLPAASTCRIRALREPISAAGQTHKVTFSSDEPWYLKGWAADIQGTGDD